MIKLVSFSYRSTPPKADIVVDCRKFLNPFSVPVLRPLNGTHAKVQEYMMSDPRFMAQLNWLINETTKVSHDSIACGCHGGHHRSVSMIEMMAKALRAVGRKVEVQHTELA